MHLVSTTAQIIVALGIFNVWILRYGKSTSYRGGGSQNMREEFAAYGLPHAFMLAIGGIKITLAIALVVGIWVPRLVLPAALAMAALMLAAIAMHIKVSDSFRKSVPAICMLVLSLLAAAF